MAALPIALSIYYLTMVAPSKIPVPKGVSVPFPAATRFLEGVVMWCQGHPFLVVMAGVGLLIPGFVSRIFAERYYIWLAVATSLAIGFTYLSISAPIDRLIETVKENLPEERKTPDFLPGEVNR